MYFPFTKGAAEVGETEKNNTTSLCRVLGNSQPSSELSHPLNFPPHTKPLFLRHDWPLAGVRQAGEVWTRRRQRALQWWTWKTISSGFEGDCAADRLTSRNWALAQRQMALAAGAKKAPATDGRVERRTRPGSHLYCPSSLLLLGWGRGELKGAIALSVSVDRN